jgi:hypothetical protein
MTTRVGSHDWIGWDHRPVPAAWGEILDWAITKCMTGERRSSPEELQSIAAGKSEKVYEFKKAQKGRSEPHYK